MGFIRGVPIKKISQEIGKKLVEHLSKKLVSPLGSKSVTHLGAAGEGSGLDRLGAGGEGDWGMHETRGADSCLCRKSVRKISNSISAAWIGQ